MYIDSMEEKAAAGSSVLYPTTLGRLRYVERLRFLQVSSALHASSSVFHACVLSSDVRKSILRWLWSYIYS